MIKEITVKEAVSFQIKKYEDADKEVWNDFLLNCKNYHFMFNRNFMDYYSGRFEDFSLMFKNDKDKIVALLLGNIYDIVQCLTIGMFLIDKDCCGIDMLNQLPQLRSFIKDCYIKKIIYKCITNIIHHYSARKDLYAVFLNKTMLYRMNIRASINI